MPSFTRRTALSGALCALALGLPAQTRAAQRTKAMPDSISAVRTQAPIVALTFDDGPHPSLTPALLDLLRARQMRATFYVIGERAVRWPHLIRRIHDEGHEIGNHSWTHPNLAGLDDQTVMTEIDRTADAVFRVAGRPPVTFRPPYGAFTGRQSRTLLETRRVPTVLWSVDPSDWRKPGAEVVAQRILDRTRPGAIILTHDIHPGTIAAMPRTLDTLKARGLQVATVSQLLGWPVWQNRRFRKAV